MFTHSVDLLDSGLTVIRVPMSSVKSVTVLALVNAGSRYEPKNWWGISHFLEHMVFKGTQHYPNAQALSGAVDAVGAKFNAFTSKEYTGYYVKAAAKRLRLALDVVSDMLLTPKLLQDDIDREKGVIIEEMNMYADMPASHISNLFEQMMFDESTLGHDIIGTKETVSSITSENFQSYLQNWYGLKNIVLIIAGDESIVGDKKTLELAEEMFKKGNAKTRESSRTKDHLGKQPPLLDKKLRVEFKKTEQAHFILGFPSVKRDHPRRHALSLLGVILGGGMSSRLFSEVREKRGLCYYIHTDSDFYHDTGVFGASAGVDPKRVEEAISVTVDEFFATVNGKKPITEAELRKAKEFIAGKFVLDLEDSESVAQYFGMKQLLLGEIETPDELLKRYMLVTLEQVQEIAREIIQKGALRFAIIGPFKNHEKKFATLIAEHSK
jgi:predicted Zn-dependent peptidase